MEPAIGAWCTQPWGHLLGEFAGAGARWIWPQNDQ
jgi:hypothetical protein